MNNKFLIFFTLSQLYKQRVHLGTSSTMMCSIALRYTLPIKSKFLIIDLNKTAILLKTSFNILSQILEKRGNVLIVNESKILVSFLKKEFNLLNQPVSYENWAPGLLSNYKSVRNSSLKTYFLKKQFIINLFKLDSKGLLSSKTRNVIKSSFNFLKFKKELSRYIKSLNRVPNAIFVFDSLLSNIAISEAKSIGIISLVICDTNANNFGLNYAIPGNSTSIKSLFFYFKLLKLIVLKSILRERQNFFNEVIRNKKKFMGLNFLLTKFGETNSYRGTGLSKFRSYFIKNNLLLNPHLDLYNKDFFYYYNANELMFIFTKAALLQKKTNYYIQYLYNKIIQEASSTLSNFYKSIHYSSFYNKQFFKIATTVLENSNYYYIGFKEYSNIEYLVNKTNPLYSNTLLLKKYQVYFSNYSSLFNTNGVDIAHTYLLSKKGF